MTSEKLLKKLDEERNKFSRADEKKMQFLVDQLLAKGTYYITKTMQQYNYSPLTMVRSYGAYWHLWSAPFVCPFCSTDLRDHETGPPFKREIGIYDMDRDRTVQFECPDCHKRWDRC